MKGNSRSVSTNQPGIHEKLPKLVERYLHSATQKPIQQHTENAYEMVIDWLKNYDKPSVILDSCCGIGESTWRLAQQYPESVVIGVDKSFARVQKHGQQPEYQEYDPSLQKPSNKDSDENAKQPDVQESFMAKDNYCVVRADVIDFWRLIQPLCWNIEKHFIFYPNPYPKSAQLQKRWHGSPSFKDILNIGGEITVRSNWKIYIEEFAVALKVANKNPAIIEVEQTEPFTPFERKYWKSGQQSWQVTCQL